MTLRPALVPCFLSALLLAAPAMAQQHKLTPGLWESEFTMKSADGKMEAAMAQAQQAMAKMPPEQRAQMEAMMKQRGVSMPGGAGQPAKVSDRLLPLCGRSRSVATASLDNTWFSSSVRRCARAGASRAWRLSSMRGL